MSAAARRLGIDRSGVSRRLKELENQANAQLIVRDTRNMALTALGEAFYTRCVDIREQVEQANSVLHSQGGAIQGVLHVSSPPALTRVFLMDVFDAFCRRFPEVSLRLTLQAGPVDLIEHQVDVGIRFTNNPEPQYVARLLAQTQWQLYASAAYIANAPALTSAQSLQQHAWLGIRQRIDLRLVEPDGPQRMLVSSRISCADYEMLARLCCEGLGVAMLPAYAASRPLREGRLVRVLPEIHVDPTPGSTLYALTLPSRYMPAHTRAFLTFLREQIMEHHLEGLIPANL